MTSRQKTLFQSWGASLPPPATARAPRDPKRGRGTSSNRGRHRPQRQIPSLFRPPPPGQLEDEEDDDVLLVEACEVEESFNKTAIKETGCPDHQDQQQSSPAQAPGENTHHGLKGQLHNTTEIRLPEGNGQELSTSQIQNLPGFDLSAGALWIYPTNYPVRDYQFNISQVSLLHNTLVCLPTGLGKTFIAAVVMYNFYRWYPSGKIVFMAPTKPLVAQQIEACFKIMGIPQEHMAEMTGNIQAQKRKEIWQKCRAFFLTPQIMVNDLMRGTCPATEIKCLVIDEAHKALGNHAYCQVVRALLGYTQQFRILALTATPGSDTKSVQQVVSNLLIAQIELRSEDSPDIQAYSHNRQLEKFVVPLGEELKVLQTCYLKVLEVFARRLIQNGVLSRREIPNLTKYQVILSREQFRKNPPPNIMGAQLGVIEGDFALCISLYHGYELLLQMGARSLYHYLNSIMDGSKGMMRTRNELTRNCDFMGLYEQLENLYSDSSASAPGSDVKKPFIYSHPKLKKLEEVVVQHFKSWGDRHAPNTSKQTHEDTRIMIFSSFRDSVQEIAKMLDQHHPTVRVMTFVGHSSSGKNIKGFTQKEQLEVVKRFREGGYNTLVSTCVGEEGLDIGEVDLIICFDAQKSPIRLVQRMGRTGRKRQGRIVVILSQGREERTYNQSQSNKKSIDKAVLGNNKVFQLCSQSPRMVPEGLNPKVHKMFITQGTYENKDSAPPLSKAKLSSLGHHRLSLFDQNDSLKEGWPLTHREYETWNSLYRLNESDGITDVLLPRSRFESFKAAEETPEEPDPPRGNVRKLSLTEWRLWQNQSLPTEFVDHSDRCKHFTATMEMIELMRLEEGVCSYDLEMKSYLHKEDVGMKKVPAKTHLTHSSTNRPKHLVPSTTTLRDAPHSSVETESDFKCSVKSTSTSLKPISRSHLSEDLECAVALSPDPADSESPPCILEGPLMPSEFPALDPFNGEGIDAPLSRPKTSSVSDINSKLSTCTEDVQSKSHTFDSGSQCFNDHSSAFSSMSYGPPTPSNDFVFTEFLADRQHECQDILTRTKHFLSCSPPPLSSLDDFDVAEFTSAAQSTFPDLKREHLESLTPIKVTTDLPKLKNNPDQSMQDYLSDVISSDIAEEIHRNLVVLTPEFEKPLCESKIVSAYCEDMPNQETCFKPIISKEPEDDENDPEWDNLFECDNEQLDFSPKSTLSPSLSVDHLLEDDAASPTGVTLPDHQDISSELFEDDPFCDIVQENSNSGQGKTIETTSVTFNLFDPSIFEDGSEQDSDTNEISSSAYDCSEEMFSVNFDLGFSVDDSSLESEASSKHGSDADCKNDLPHTPLQESTTNVIEDLGFSVDYSLSECEASPKRGSDADCKNNMSHTPPKESRTDVVEGSGSESEDSVVFRRKRKLTKINVLKSPEIGSSDCDFDSPIPVVKKRKRVFRTGCAREFFDDQAELSSGGESVSSDENDASENEQDTSIVDFLNDNTLTQDPEMHAIYLKSLRSPALGNRFKMVGRKKTNMAIFSQVPEQDESYMEDSFFVADDQEQKEEESLSEEEVEADLDLLQQDSFVDGRKQYRTRRRVNLKSGQSRQNIEKPPVKKRTRIILHDSSEEETGQTPRKLATSTPLGAGNFLVPTKLPLGCSFSENSFNTPLKDAIKVPLRDRCQVRINLKAATSEELDFSTTSLSCMKVGTSNDKTDSACKPSSSSARMNLCHGSTTSSQVPVILADSREISSGSEVISCLKTAHGVNVEVCSLRGCDYIVSNRLAVERKFQSEFSNSANRSKLVERVKHLQNLFERVCLILEKDRVKPGETTRPFQRTKYYDSTLSALIDVGVQILFSSSQEETAGLLKELVLLEQRKHAAITVPTQVTGHKQDELRFYLSIPNVSYVTALNMCHHCASVKQILNSSLAEIAKCGEISDKKAEEIYRYLRNPSD
ncbi:Fanconi anemia group M protein isoform X2 [Pelobates fuscus]|uniref:Fanconi anemia group M protein isoform X2 n=1 Tax=Pelobates fuscus TaxID=191477 RepID=UPI002FE4EACF